MAMNSSKTKRPRGSLSSHMTKNKTQAAQALQPWVEIYPERLRHLGEETLFSHTGSCFTVTTERSVN